MTYRKRFSYSYSKLVLNLLIQSSYKLTAITYQQLSAADLLTLLTVLTKICLTLNLRIGC